MAVLSFDELIRAVDEHPEIGARWTKDIPAREGLVIQFTKRPLPPTRPAKMFQLRSGHELAIEEDEDGVVVQIEFL